MDTKKYIAKKKLDYLEQQRRNNKSYIYNPSNTVELLPGYIEEEIKTSEDIIGERFPEYFREYLINVSRETYFTTLPHVFKLPTEEIGSSIIPDDVTTYTFTNDGC